MGRSDDKPKKLMHRSDHALCRKQLKTAEGFREDLREYLDDMCYNLSPYNGDSWWPDNVNLVHLFAVVTSPNGEQRRVRIPEKYRTKLVELRKALDACDNALHDIITKIAYRNQVLPSTINPKTGEIGDRVEIAFSSSDDKASDIEPLDDEG